MTFPNQEAPNIHWAIPEPLSTKRMDVLPQDLVKSRSREIECYNERVALKFDRLLGSTAAEVPVKFQSDWKCLTQNLVASRLHDILWEDVLPLSKIEVMSPTKPDNKAAIMKARKVENPQDSYHAVGSHCHSIPTECDSLTTPHHIKVSNYICGNKKMVHPCQLSKLTCIHQWLSARLQ